MSKDIQVTVTGERAELFQKVFGTNTVCVVSPLPQRVDLPGLGEQSVYMLDMNEVTPEQRERLKEELARRFCLLEDEVDEQLDVYGVPILADHCVMTATGAALGLLMPDDLFGLNPGLDAATDDDWDENEY